MFGNSVIYDPSDFGVSGSITFGPDGVSGAVQGNAGSMPPPVPCANGGCGGGGVGVGIGITPGMLVLIVAVVILVAR